MRHRQYEYEYYVVHIIPYYIICVCTCPFLLLLLQVVEFKASNGDLEERVAKLVSSNEKLADDEGRWYSLARELENQMDVIKKVRTELSL